MLLSSGRAEAWGFVLVSFALADTERDLISAAVGIGGWGWRSVVTVQADGGSEPDSVTAVRRHAGAAGKTRDASKIDLLRGWSKVRHYDHNAIES